MMRVPPPLVESNTSGCRTSDKLNILHPNSHVVFCLHTLNCMWNDLRCDEFNSGMYDVFMWAFIGGGWVIFNFSIVQVIFVFC